VAVTSVPMNAAPDIVYLHGFRSSPDSEKARILRDHLASIHYGGDVHIPALHTDPQAVYTQIESLLLGLQQAGKDVVLIGSSLGGFFATLFAERFGLRAALINPAVYPYELLTDYCGEHTNMYTGERFTVTPDHIESLRRMYRPVTHPERFFVLVQTGDETLDFRQALERFKGARLFIGAGGDHSFSDFDRRLPDILGFLCQKRL